MSKPQLHSTIMIMSFADLVEVHTRNFTYRPMPAIESDTVAVMRIHLLCTLRQEELTSFTAQPTSMKDRDSRNSEHNMHVGVY